ncbi:MAG: SDR family NAD(P)-dependent oxidoreductase [Candidatus Margulisiibacteriota bacterium]|jgi:short-subunit dehydrogenase
MKAIIIGASSGIGKALAFELSNRGYILGIAARKVDILKGIQKELPNKSFVHYLDVANPTEAKKNLDALIKEIGQVDLIIINAGVGAMSKTPDWEQEKFVLEVNVIGFVAMAIASANYFLKQGVGHIVGISSIAGLLYEADASSYAASKAFVSNYLKGLRVKLSHLNKKIIITDIKPGYVETPLIKDVEIKPFVLQPEKAARLIADAIETKKRRVYIPKRTAFGAYILATCLKLAPSFFEKIIFLKKDK